MRLTATHLALVCSRADAIYMFMATVCLFLTQARPQLQSLFVQEAANRALGSISKADLHSARQVLDTGLLHCIKQQLNGGNASVKEAGLSTISCIAASSSDMAHEMLDDELLGKLVAELKSASNPCALLETAAHALAMHAAHSAALAARIIQAGAPAALVAILQQRDAREHKLRAAALRCLCQLAHHETTSATEIAQAGAVEAALPAVVDDKNASVRHAAAALLQRIATRTPALSKMVASQGAVAALVQSLELDISSQYAMAPLTALGHIAAFGATFSQAVRALGSVSMPALLSSQRSRTCWTLQLLRHACIGKAGSSMRLSLSRHACERCSLPQRAAMLCR